MLVSGGDEGRDKWLLVLRGSRNALLLISLLLVVSFFRADQQGFLRRTIFAEVAAMLIFGVVWLIWQRSGMALYQQRARARTLQGATADYNYRAALNGWLAFILTMTGSIAIAVLVGLAGF
ncbi:MAG: hypothetical protein DLM69_03960 [Candidatus Chloroheliales bacterium]|nr:MAG: hypothetical protein DLM69_03960 [Chloroflexota bacterium]